MPFNFRIAGRRSLFGKQQHCRPSEIPPPVLLQPLSLQQSSINCIVTNLEKYPPDLLALLPLHFRRELLLLLPPADIFQLEQTKFIEGIDMENEIWKVVSERYDYKAARTAHIDRKFRFTSHAMKLRHAEYFYDPIDGMLLPHGLEPCPPGSSLPKPFSWKSHFLSCLVLFLLCMTPLQLRDNIYMSSHYTKHFGHRNYIVFLQLLFCNQFFKLKQLADVGGFPLQVSGVTLLPSRYSRFYTSLVSQSEWVRYLLEDCHIEPPSVIKIDLNQSQFNIESATSFQHFSKKVKAIYIFINQQTREEKTAQLCRLLTACHQLENICIVQTHGHKSRRIYDDSQLNKILQVCFPHPRFVKDIDCKSQSCLFQGLKRIDVTNYRTEIYLSTLCSLFVVIQKEGFESISVCGPLTVKCNDQQKAVVIIQSLVSDTPISSSCCLISLSDIKQIPFSFLFWLMKLFLYSPSTITQKMAVLSCEIDYSVVPSEKELKSIPDPPDLANSHKSLHLTRLATMMEHGFVEAFFPFAFTCLR